MIKIIEMLIFAVVQSITEWMPISSSGHLVIVQECFGLRLPSVFYVMLQVGKLCTIFAVFWEDIVEMLKALLRLNFKADEGRLALFIIVGSIPTAIVSILFNNFFGLFFYNLLAVGIGLIITGFFLIASGTIENGKKLGFWDSLLIGAAQSIALIPGISRSGTTISTGLLRGIKKETVFKYSFLLSIPTVIGSTIIQFRYVAIGDVDVISMFFGLLVSIIVGYMSLKLLFKIIRRHKFHYFSCYCFLIGAIIVFLAFLT